MADGQDFIKPTAGRLSDNGDYLDSTAREMFRLVANAEQSVIQ